MTNFAPNYHFSTRLDIKYVFHVQRSTIFFFFLEES